MNSDIQSDSSDSSDSDDTLNEKIRSSVIDVNDFIEQQSHQHKDNNSHSHNKHSLRHREDCDEGNVGLDTTPQFREFLARKLVDSLYSKIKFKKSKHKEVNGTTDRTGSCENGQDTAVWGFRLFNNSNPQTPFHEHYVPVNQKRRITCVDTSDSDDDDERFASVAVTADMIRAERDAELSVNQSGSIIHQTDHNLGANSNSSFKSRDGSSSVGGNLREEEDEKIHHNDLNVTDHNDHSVIDHYDLNETGNSKQLHADKVKQIKVNVHVWHKKKKNKSQ